MTRLLALLGTLALIQATAFADPIFETSQGSQGGFAWSFLHTGSGSGSGVAVHGEAARVDGSFTGSWDGITLSGINGSLQTFTNGLAGKIPGLDSGEILTITITGGAIRTDFDLAGNVASGGYAAGYLDYTLSAPGVSESGSFVFAPRLWSGADPRPNSLDVNYAAGDDYALWGNNWLNNYTTDASFTSMWDNVLAAVGTSAGSFAQSPAQAHQRLGVDLRGPAVPVPEPGSLALVALGAIGIVAVRRRRRAAS